MLRSFRAHWAAAFFIVIAAVFTGISLFTCNWSYIWLKQRSIFGGNEMDTGLYGMDSCAMNIYDELSGIRPAWVTITLILVATAFGCQCFLLFIILVSSVFRRYHEHILKVDSFWIGVSSFCLVSAVFLYPIATTIYLDYYNEVDDWEFGYSFYLCIVAAIFSLLAGAPVGHALKRIHDCGDHHCEIFEY